MKDRRAASICAFVLLSVLTLPRLSAGDPPSNVPEPELYGEGVLSTSDDELGAAFTPDGRTVYFTLRSPTTTTAPLTTICVSHLDTATGRWSEPEVAPFSGRFNDAGAALSPDGEHLFFASDRPAPGKESGGSGQADVDLWVMDRVGDGWSEPRNLGAPVNTPAVEQSPMVAAGGTLYFASSRPGGKGSLDLYRSRLVDGRYAEPEPLAEINTEAYEGQPALSPDGSLLVFAAAGRPDNLVSGGFPYGKADLYLSVRTATGWSAPRPLPPPINTTASESSPGFSPDGKWLYFTSERSPFTVPMPQALTGGAMGDQLHRVLSGSGNLYRIETAVLRALVAADAPAVSTPAVSAPAAEARLWGEGVISTRDDEFGAQLVGDTIFFDRSVPRSQLYAIHVSHQVGGRWSTPEVAPFSGTWRDSDPVLSADGRRIFFVSDRPREGKPVQDYDIWYVERTASGWSEARHLDGPPNSEGSEYFASTTRDGTLYFTSNRPGSKGGIDVWRSRLVDGRYAEAENLGDVINRPGWTNIEALVAPDESFLILGSFGRGDDPGDCGLYVSYRKDGVWRPAQSLGAGVNSAARDYSPRFSPDGRTLFFTSERGLPIRPRTHAFSHRELVEALHSVLNGLGNIYEVDLKAALPPPAP